MGGQGGGGPATPCDVPPPPPPAPPPCPPLAPVRRSRPGHGRAARRRRLAERPLAAAGTALLAGRRAGADHTPGADLAAARSHLAAAEQGAGPRDQAPAPCQYRAAD